MNTDKLHWICSLLENNTKDKINIIVSLCSWDNHPWSKMSSERVECLLTDTTTQLQPPPPYSEVPGTVPLHSGRNSGPPPSYDDVINPDGKTHSTLWHEASLLPFRQLLFAFIVTYYSHVRSSQTLKMSDMLWHFLKFQSLSLNLALNVHRAINSVEWYVLFVNALYFYVNCNSFLNHFLKQKPKGH
jgi:hypothetical protein